jgi:hypothetical protein
MNRLFVLAFAASMLLNASIGFSQKEADDSPSIEEVMKRMIDLGPGVHMVQKDKKGRITSCMIVGQSRISTALGKTKGIEVAREKADLECSAEFVKWLKEEVLVFQSSDEETVFLLEGGETAEVDSLKESGKAVEKNSKKMESLSKGLVRGMQILHKQVDGEGKTYSIVKGWKADTAEGVKKVSSDLSSDEPVGKGKKKDENKPSNKAIDKQIESGSATSDEASSFLPKKKK